MNIKHILVLIKQVGGELIIQSNRNY